MLRSGLEKNIHPASFPSHISGGAFSVPKDLDRDRIIGDRRPRNGTERLIGKSHLPWAPRLRRLLLQVNVSSAFILVTFQIVTTLIV